MTEETYTVEMTGEQAHVLAMWLSSLAQEYAGDEGKTREQIEMLAPVGKRCIEIAAEAGEWEDP